MFLELPYQVHDVLVALAVDPHERRGFWMAGRIRRSHPHELSARIEWFA